VINPTAVILSSVMMLKHLQFFDAAETIENALFATLQKGVLTGDVVGYDRGSSTSDFASAIIANLGESVDGYTIRRGRPLAMPTPVADPVTVVPTERRVVGVDVFVESGLMPDELGPLLDRLVESSALRLKMSSNRGTLRRSLALPVHG